MLQLDNYKSFTLKMVVLKMVSLKIFDKIIIIVNLFSLTTDKVSVWLRMTMKF